ncbi:MAG: DNA cytosine methyltransferase, partial [Myxococcota bacterium]
MTRVLELFAGLGGVAEALRGVPGVEVIAAVDHDEAAHRAYTANFDHPAHRLNLASVRDERLARFEVDAWWMSPPCQPFTVRGRRRDVDDPRCGALLRLVDAIPAVRPRRIGLENVPGFAGSIAHTRLLATLRAEGYAFAQVERCPTELGIPGERRRFYLLADRQDDVTIPSGVGAPRPLADYLDAEPDDALFVPPEIVERYTGGLAIVDPDTPGATAHCFTAAYGRSWVYSGSYLRDGARVRRFSPREILRLLGFSDAYGLPDVARLPKRYKLVGNSLSVDVVRGLLGSSW